MIIKKQTKLIFTISIFCLATQAFVFSPVWANTFQSSRPVELVEERPPWAAGNTGVIHSRPTQNRRVGGSRVDVRRLADAAQRGDAESQYALGMLYQSGNGVRTDRNRASQWLAKAANRGHTKAQYALAVLYRNVGNPKYLQASLDWQRRSAQGGYTEAQYGLGLLYFNGQYVQKDTQLAQHWLQKAAASGHQLASAALRNMPFSQQRQFANTVQPMPAPSGSRGATGYLQEALNLAAIPPVSIPDLSAKPQSRSKQRLPASKRAPVPPPAQPKVNINLHGQSVEQLRQGAMRGDQHAQLMLGALYEEGAQGVEKDEEQALRWYLKAARQGYTKAQHNLALLYEDGRGIPQDYRQAAIWYKKAAASGFSESQNNLAVLYILGRGVERDFDKAKQLLESAIDSGNQDAERNLRLLQAQGG